MATAPKEGRTRTSSHSSSGSLWRHDRKHKHPIGGRRFLFIAGYCAVAVSLLGIVSGSAVASTTRDTSSGSSAALYVQVNPLEDNSSSVLIQAEEPYTAAVPSTITYVPVAEGTVSANSSEITVPWSAALSDFAQTTGGMVNFMAVESNGQELAQELFTTVLGTSSSTSQARGHVQSATTESTVPTISLGTLQAVISDPSTTTLSRVAHTVHAFARSPEHFDSLTPASSVTPDGGVCVITELSSDEILTRIGELHVADLSGSSGEYISSNQTDNTIEVGFSLTAGSGFSDDGTLGLSNSITSGGGFTHDGGYSQYVDEHVYYAEYDLGGDCAGYYLEATSTPGDAQPGVNSAPTDPYGSCSADPNGFATVPSDGSWGDDRSTAYFYSGIANWLGFSFSGSDGYDSDVFEKWSTAKGAPATDVCGNVDPVQDSTIFWNNPA